MSLVELARFPDSMTAHIVKGRLEAADIQAYCFDTGMNYAEGAPLMFNVRLMVLDEDLADARAVLAERVPEPLMRRADEGYSTGKRQRRLARYLQLYLGLVFLLWLAVSFGT